MSRVLFEPESNQWVHVDTGNRIDGFVLQNQEPHVSELRRRGALAGHIQSRNAERISGDTTLPGTVDQEVGEVPIPPTNPNAMEEYVDEILSQANYA